ncbi:hypothetical protein KFK09_007876 [Dendrobium nobile]|uniref:Uncharacterized protein n=1 Tax=Dendrobium nobile TaxID=94219 RepID=A0A8T3BYD5_DENNO|nr:hypothetical protein KFK09_007876 [Dendrobium nobile]
MLEEPGLLRTLSPAARSSPSNKLHLWSDCYILRGLLTDFKKKDLRDFILGFD